MPVPGSGVVCHDCSEPPLSHHRPKVSFVHSKKRIQTLSTQTADLSLAIGVGLGRANGSFERFDPQVLWLDPCPPKRCLNDRGSTNGTHGRWEWLRVVPNQQVKFPLDICQCVAVWLRTMRSHSVTDNCGCLPSARRPYRRAALELLRLEILPVAQIALAFRVSRQRFPSAFGRCGAKLVRERRRGRLRLYRINPQPLPAVDQSLAQYRAFLSTKLVHLKTLVEPGNASGAQASLRPFT